MLEKIPLIIGIIIGLLILSLPPVERFSIELFEQIKKAALKAR
jgi:hypothetical protein